MSGIGNLSGNWQKMSGEPGPSAPPEKKAGVEDSGTTVETIKLGGVSSTEELDIRTLQTKNRKLAEMLDQRQAIEDELREHIEKLECQQATDDASLLIINRYWNQFDENTRIILKRFNLDQGLGDFLSERKALVVPEPEPDSDSNQERKDERERGEGLEPAFSFLATLASSTSEEIESQLQERVESSRRAVAQIVTTYDNLQEKMNVLSHKLNSGDISLMEEAVVELHSCLSHENGRLQELVDVLQEKHRVMSQELEEMNAELEENKELAGNCLNEVEELSQDLDEVELRRAVEEAVKETPEYRCMQSQFSVLYNESLQLKVHLDEARMLQAVYSFYLYNSLVCSCCPPAVLCWFHPLVNYCKPFHPTLTPPTSPWVVPPPQGRVPKV
ncbi:E3 ubiquitin-protein ligase BRE1A-like isoform X1 [Cyanistes caeruleus]|uniref:E3 ubiquitin-protein ligase BRE1A-like isoform X1 n=1 Tax=Cyanistes caeruleus TaxID=156563 RepID=UPI000CDAE6FD|nr:E3 ubiquitin-protein ligase BRE1A-like isoform X1 [Cyanistes caeruleus]